MGIRQFHSVFPIVSLISLILGSLTAYLLIFVYDFAIYGFMFGYAVKYLVEIIWFGAILAGKGTQFNLRNPEL